MGLTWEPPLTWRAAWRSDTAQLELYDAGRRLRATLALVVADTPGTQILGPIGRWVDEVPLRAWKSRHGGLLHGGLASILMPDGTVGEAWNGKQHGWRRTHRNGHVVLAGRGTPSAT